MTVIMVLKAFSVISWLQPKLRFPAFLKNKRIPSNLDKSYRNDPSETRECLLRVRTRQQRTYRWKMSYVDKIWRKPDPTGPVGRKKDTGVTEYTGNVIQLCGANSLTKALRYWYYYLRFISPKKDWGPFKTLFV